jgi:hypothetical protein
MGLCRDQTADGKARQLAAIRRLPGNLRVRENAWWRMQPCANLSPNREMRFYKEICRDFRVFLGVLADLEMQKVPAAPR